MTALPAPTIDATPMDTNPADAVRAVVAAPSDAATVAGAAAGSDWVQDPARILPGDRVEVWDQETLCHVGTVGQSAAHLGLLWILEARTGSRRLIPFHSCRLRLSPFARTA